MRLVLASALAFGVAGCKEDGKKTETPQTGAVKQAEQPQTQPDKAGSQPNPHGEAFENKGPPGKPISGLVKLGEGITQEDVKPTDVLFIMARESQGGGKFGRLVGVQRHGKVEFPKRYEISSSDVMVPGIPFKGPFVVMARLDRDGDPMTRKPEDLYGVFSGEVMNGQEGVHLVLSKGKVEDMTPPPSEGAQSQPAKKPASQPH